MPDNVDPMAENIKNIIAPNEHIDHQNISPLFCQFYRSRR